VVIGGFIALAGTWLQTRAQQRVAQAERLWNKRAELYVDLLNPPRTDVPLEHWRVVATELAARIDAFGSPEALRRFEARNQAAEHMQYYASENGFMYDLTDPLATPIERDDELKRLEQQYEAARVSLCDQIRTELGTRDADKLVRRLTGRRQRAEVE
jgi:hypothetical protein